MNNTQINLASVDDAALLEALRVRLCGEHAHPDTARLDYVLELVNGEMSPGAIAARGRLDRRKVDTLMEMKEAGVDLWDVLDARLRGK